MRILFYIHALTGGGAERVMANLVNALANRGYDVTLAMDKDKPRAYSIDEKVHVVDRFSEPLPKVTSSLWNKLYRRYWKLKQYRVVARSEKQDVVVSFMVKMNYYVTLALLGTRIPVICCEHTNVLRVFSRSITIKRNLVYPLANCITVLTHHDYKIAKKKFPWKVVRMPNPVPALNNSESLPREKVVFTVGRVNQWDVKGYDLLIKAWSKLCHDYPDWKLQIAGLGDEKSDDFFQKLIVETRCVNVEFLGFRKDVAELMRLSEVYCLSSRIEGLPMGLIEAMQAGCCCVAFDCVTGPREIIKDGVDGLLAKAEDVDDLAAKLEEAIGDEGLRKRLSSNTQAAVKRFSTEVVTYRWEILFKKIAKKRC